MHALPPGAFDSIASLELDVEPPAVEFAFPSLSLPLHHDSSFPVPSPHSTYSNRRTLVVRLWVMGCLDLRHLATVTAIWFGSRDKKRFRVTMNLDVHASVPPFPDVRAVEQSVSNSTVKWEKCSVLTSTIVMIESLRLQNVSSCFTWISGYKEWRPSGLFVRVRRKWSVCGERASSDVNLEISNSCFFFCFFVR